MSRARLFRLLRDHKGATVIFVAIAMVTLLAFAALAVDVGYLYVVRGELQNAADSGALAGAQVLYNNSGTAVNAGAIDMATEFVHKNYSEKATAELHVVGGVDDVQIGHWSFATRTFTAHDAPYPDPPDLWDRTTAELDADPDFINAVRVATQRVRDGGQTGNLPGYFFAQIFGGPNADVTASAVGYIGFAGTLKPLEADQPIAICEESIRNAAGVYTCGVGRMINSGQNSGHQTGGWTNFTQDPCVTTSVPTVKPLVCSSGNPRALTLGQDMGSTGGELQTVADKLRDCWTAYPGLDLNPKDGWPEQPWTLKLPVIECPGNNVGPCSKVVGAVTVEVVWITRTDKNQMQEVPRKMGDWPEPTGDVPIDALGRCAGSTKAEAAACWASFVKHFALKDVLNGTDAFYENKTIYFKPSCEPNIPAGITGGKNFGILAKIPVLVK